MDERISDNRIGESKFPQQPTQKTSDLVFDQITQYLQTDLKKNLLESILNASRQLQKEYTETEFKAGNQHQRVVTSIIGNTPEDVLKKAIMANFEQNVAILNFLENLSQQLKKGPPFDNHTLTNNMPSLLQTNKLQPQTRKNLQQNLSSLTSYKGNSQSLEQLLVWISAVLQTQPYEALPTSDKLKEIIDLISAKAGETPPGPLTVAAKQLTAEMSAKNPQELLALFNKSALEKKLTDLKELLTEISQNSSLMNQLNNAKDQLQAESTPAQTHRAFYNFKSSESAVQIELQDLLNLLQQLEAQGIPVGSMIASIKKAINDYPNLSATDLQSINNVWSWLTSPTNRAIENLPVSAQKNFYAQMIQMLQALQKAGATGISALQQQINALQAYESNLNAIAQDTNAINALLDQLSSKNPPITQSKLVQLLNLINDLKSREGSLSPQDQTNLNNFLNSLGNISVNVTEGSYTGPIQLGILLGDIQINQWLQEYYANPNNPRTPSAIVQYLASKLEPFNQGSNQISSDMVGEIYQDILNIQNGNYYSHALGTYAGSFFSNTTPPLNLNTQFGASIAQLFNSGTINNVDAAIAAEASYINTLQQEISTIPEEIEGIKQALEDAQALNAQWSALQNQVNSLYVFTESLPDAFSNAILNHYMPAQEAYMEELAMILSFDNLGASMNNAILSQISNFNNASIHYDFNGWVQGQANGKGGYSVSGSQAKAKISTEQQQANADYSSAQAASNAISQQVANIQKALANHQITQSQANTLLSQLSGEQASLQAAMKNIKALLTNLSTLKSAVENQGNPITISNTLLTKVSDSENTVINGGKGGVGGLSSIFNTITSNAQAWGGQSQTAQMQVQLVMTEMQQEWSVVTTAMQLLNQSYMTIAQNFNR